jgi:phosphoribosyl-ATP pyrophosphohydrolase/phosphoribosyl-AMP cyclohydrolase
VTGTEDARRAEVDCAAVRFGENGLVPGVVQDAQDGTVLMVGYVNAEALAKTLATGDVWFWSRSRRALWHKGETSGNYLRLVEVRLDCDGDALLFRARPEGPTCHTGDRSCFSRTIPGSHGSATALLPAPINDEGCRDPQAGTPRAPGNASLSAQSHPEPAPDGVAVLDALFHTIEQRRAQPDPGSYTNHLLSQGVDRIGRKIGEEAAEVIIAAKNGLAPELAGEVADLFYHSLVLLAASGVSLDDVCAVLAARQGAPRRHVEKS